MGKNLSKFNERFIKDYNENSNRGYFLEVDVEYPKNLFSSHKDLAYLPERKQLRKVEKLVCSVEDKKKICRSPKNFKRSIKSWINTKKGAIQFNQNAWLKPYIDMNTKLGKEAKNEFEKNFFKLINDSVFEKTMENMRKHRDIKLLTTDGKRKR